MSTNGTAHAALASMASRLTDPGDREAYSNLVSYVQRLPPGDEFRQLVDLLGLLSILAQHIPDAMAEFIETFREERKSAVEYHALVSELMERLPEEITATVDPVAMGKALGENFRQQIANCGVAEAVQSLTQSLGEVQTVSAKLTSALKPLSEEYSRVGSMAAAEFAKLTTVTRDLEKQSTSALRRRQGEWGVEILFAAVLILVGFVSGIWWEQGKTKAALINMQAQLERIQTPAPVVAPSPKGKERRR
jgi:hypothetical protein